MADKSVQTYQSVENRERCSPPIRRRSRCETLRKLPVGVLDDISELQIKRSLSRPERRHVVLPAKNHVDERAERRRVALVDGRIMARSNQQKQNARHQIGRASCRERVKNKVGGVS